MKGKKVKLKNIKKEVNETDNLKNQLARALADYDNLKKRVELEKEIWVKFAGERLLKKMIALLDNFESAQIHLKDQGLGIAINEFRRVLTEEGLEEIRPEKNSDFDENLHEVIEVLEGGEKGKVADLVLPGWKFKTSNSDETSFRNDGQIIRVAKVKVYK